MLFRLMRLAGICKAILGSPLWYLLTRLVLGLVFFHSGATKVLDLAGFAERVSDYGLVPEGAVYTTAVGLVVMELLGGLGLLFDLRGSLALVSGLLVLFVAVLAYGISLGLEVECGCFGLGGLDRDGGTLASALARDLLLLALCAYLYAFRSCKDVRPRSLSGVGSAARRTTKRTAWKS